jgi:putative methionine-R-sulfoxide reductase with GAF domain
VTDDGKAWANAIIANLIAAGLCALGAWWWKVFPAVWVALPVFAVCIISTLISVALVARAKHRRVQTFCSVLEALNNHQHAAITRGDRAAFKHCAAQFFETLCEQPNLPHLHAGVIFIVERRDPTWLVASFFSGKKGKSAKRFFVGKSEGVSTETAAPGAPGAAGTAFLRNSPLIVRFNAKGHADNPMYHQFHIKPTSAYRSFIVCPIRWNGNPIGVLSLESTTTYAFSENEAIWYQLIADYLAVPVYNLS